MTDKLKNIVYSLHPLERKVLPYVSLGDVSSIAKKASLSEAEVNTAVAMLDDRGYCIYEKLEEKFVGLDKFGLKYLKTDLPEIKFLKEILDSSKKMSELSLDKEEFSSALGILKRNNLVDIEKGEEGLIFSAKDSANEFLKNFENKLFLFENDVLLNDLSNEQKEVLASFKQRKGFLKEFLKKSFSVKLTSEGEDIANEILKKYMDLELVEAIDSKMLKSGDWKNKEFRHYDIAVDVPILDIGRRHPMIEANNILRDVFIEMGFCEMEGPMVESAFWNMDTMWIPQDHPARDEQDTFYLEGESVVPSDLVEKVKDMHEEGIKKTHTLKGEWSENITKKRLLRTHSTATSFRTLYELGEKFKNGENIDGKYFYVANVFRNEAIDATHLAEFYQAEGFIIGDNLSLADLMGFVREFYLKFGLDKIKFKPTFNPYTEPSMEAHYYDSSMDKWYALINSGVFRQETLEPLGLGGKKIIAWGMGASRVATLLSGKSSMRDITGATCDFEWLKTRPIMKRKIVRNN